MYNIIHRYTIYSRNVSEKINNNIKIKKFRRHRRPSYSHRRASSRQTLSSGKKTTIADARRVPQPEVYFYFEKRYVIIKTVTFAVSARTSICRKITTGCMGKTYPSDVIMKSDTNLTYLDTCFSAS